MRSNSPIKGFLLQQFGRRASENASLGADHGHRGLMMLMGGNVQGRNVHGQRQGLEEGHFFGPGDLAFTTDYRNILAEVCLKRQNNPMVERIVPNHQSTIHGFIK